MGTSEQRDDNLRQWFISVGLLDPAHGPSSQVSNPSLSSKNVKQLIEDFKSKYDILLSNYIDELRKGDPKNSAMDRHLKYRAADIEIMLHNLCAVAERDDIYDLEYDEAYEKQCVSHLREAIDSSSDYGKLLTEDDRKKMQDAIRDFETIQGRLRGEKSPSR